MRKLCHDGNSGVGPTAKLTLDDKELTRIGLGTNRLTHTQDNAGFSL